MKIKLCWFNQHWNVYLYSPKGDRSWEIIEVTHKDQDGGMYRLTKYNVDGETIYTFGLLTHDLKARPGHGGEWSSNPQNINRVFGLNLIHIGMDNVAASIDLDRLKYMLGAKYKIVETNWGYEVLDTEESEHTNHEWITL